MPYAKPSIPPARQAETSSNGNIVPFVPRDPAAQASAHFLLVHYAVSADGQSVELVARLPRDKAQEVLRIIRAAGIEIL